MDPSVGHLNSILARVRGNLRNNFQKSQMPGAGGGEGARGVARGAMLKLPFDRYIICKNRPMVQCYYNLLTLDLDPIFLS